MRLHDLLEAPISDYSYTATSKATSFTKPEAAVLSSEKGKQKFIKAFQRTPFNFRVIFKNNTRVDASDPIDNNNVQDWTEKLKVGIYDSYTGVKGQSGIITVVMLGNLSGETRIPMTPWVLAHKIGHAFQDGLSNNSAPTLSDDLKELIGEINLLLLKLSRGEPTVETFMYPPDEVQKYMTMRSARIHNE